MLRRTKGRLLLTLLVITGLAGTINDTSLSKKERKLAISIMKNTKAEVTRNVKGLLPDQLSFKAGPGHYSVKEYLYQLASTQSSLCALFQSAMKKPANPEQRSLIKYSDSEIVDMLKHTAGKEIFPVTSDPRKLAWKTTDVALSDFKNKLSAHIQYINSSTEDMRNRVVQMPFGWIDCYQLSLAIAANGDHISRQIAEIKKSPGFPKQ